MTKYTLCVDIDCIRYTIPIPIQYLIHRQQYIFTKQKCCQIWGVTVTAALFADLILIVVAATPLQSNSAISKRKLL